MIVFCEECSQRNTINEEQVKNCRVTFRCCVCNYLNTYPLIWKKEKALDRRQFKESGALVGLIRPFGQILETVNRLSGVAGSFLYDSANGVRVNAMPKEAKHKGLIDLGSRLARQFKLASSQFSNSCGVNLVWHHQAVIYRPIQKEIGLVVLTRVFPMNLDNENALDRCVKELEELHGRDGGGDSRDAE